jgi:glycosyltransferase involved in cell wall biosynthesis
MLPRGEAVADPAQATFGGWISTMLAQVSAQPGVTIGVAVRSPGAAMERRELNGIVHYYLPPSGAEGLDISDADCRAVLADFAPDLLHAEGTEMAYTRRFLRTWPGANVVSMQGVLHGYEPYEYGGLSVDEMLTSWRPGQMLVGAGMAAAKRLRFAPRLKAEAEAMALAKTFIGRTEWDRAHAFALNPAAPYFTVHRVLRPSFYERRWSLDQAKRHTVFIGNAAQARKGAHFAVRAVAQLRRHYPDIRLQVAGPEPETLGGLKNRIGYPAYLRALIDELKIGDRVNFTGVLSADEMAERMARSHVFLLPSLIENSPNSLAEAMALGTPVVSAYSGGAPDMAAPDREALFYRAEDPALLAWQLKRIFDSDDLALSLSAAARERALKTHDPADNRDRLLAAYRTILGAK